MRIQESKFSQTFLAYYWNAFSLLNFFKYLHLPEILVIPLILAMRRRAPNWRHVVVVGQCSTAAKSRRRPRPPRSASGRCPGGTFYHRAEDEQRTTDLALLCSKLQWVFKNCRQSKYMCFNEVEVSVWLIIAAILVHFFQPLFQLYRAMLLKLIVEFWKNYTL